MAVWARAQQLPKELMDKVHGMYGDHFPIEVRHFLSSWLEEKIWPDVEPDHPQYEQYVSGFVAALIQELESKAASIQTEELFLTKIKLVETAKIFRQKYVHNPVQLFRTIRHCMGMEMKLVAQAENLDESMMHLTSEKANMMIGDSTAEITQQIDALRRRTYETGEDLRRMEQEQESFAIGYHECTKLNAHISHLNSQPTQQNVELEKKLRRQKEQQEQLLNSKVAGVMTLRLQLIDKLKESIHNLNTLQSRVLDDELIRWKREQQLAGNGAPFNSNLDNIQEWCENLAETIWLNRTQIKEAERLKQKFGFDPAGIPDVLPTLNSQITQLLSSLVTSTFIIEKQPPQVMKTNTRFTSTVRLLVGGKLSVHMTPPQVKVSIISEAQANSLLKSDKMAKTNGDASGEILNNTGTMEYHQATRQLSVSFRNMQLKKIKRAEKKGTESVMDEKFSLLFQSQFSVGGGELVFQVWTLSLPVVVIVHGNQEPHAWATVTWDNAFAEPGRVPFAVPEKVPWCQVADALNVKFRSATGRSLTEDNLRFLAEKVFRGAGNSPVQDYSNLLLSWAQFCKEPLPERSFTFWEWFYAVMKLTREHLRGPWIDGYILGFVRKKQAEEMLSNCACGTFLMRFSDSELGGITIAWVGDQADQVFMLQPFTSKDFTIRSLADRVYDLQHLSYLYPDISKDQAFSKYYTPFNESQATSTNGYVKPLLVTHVPGWSGPGIGGQTPSHSSVVGVSSNGQGGPGGSYPATPQNMFQAHSPDPSVTRDTPSVASSYAPALGQSGVGRQDMQDYAELMGHNELSIDENLNLDNLNGFGFDFIQSYNNVNKMQ